MIPPTASGNAFRLVRAVQNGGLAGYSIYEDDLPATTAVLATLAAGLLADLADATGQDPEAMLDMLETRSMERLLA